MVEVSSIVLYWFWNWFVLNSEANYVLFKGDYEVVVKDSKFLSALTVEKPQEKNMLRPIPGELKMFEGFF